MVIEFRDENGNHMMTFSGELAEVLVDHFSKSPQVEKKVMKIAGKGEFVVFEAIVQHGYKFQWRFGGIEYLLKKGAYVKVC